MQRGELHHVDTAAAAGGAEEALKRAACVRAVDLIVGNGIAPSALRAELRELASAEGLDSERFLFGVFGRAAAVQQLRRLAPRVAVDAVLRLLAACGDFGAASVWVGEPGARTSCVAAVGHRSDLALAGPFRSAALTRFQRPAGVLLVAGGPAEEQTGSASAYLEDAAFLLGLLLERDLLLERNAERERALTASLERRLTRLAYDLHDGPLQNLASLAADVALMRSQLTPSLDAVTAARVGGRFDDLQSQLESLDRDVRATLESSRGGSGIASLERALQQEVLTFARMTGIVAHLQLEGHFDEVTDSRRVAIFRVVQEALSNVRDHSGAGTVAVRVIEQDGRVEVSVEDDGRGFDLAETLVDSIGRGRFGLSGMRERVRLLGGDLSIRSGSSGGTRVGFSLDPWHPLGETEPEPDVVV